MTLEAMATLSIAVLALAFKPGPGMMMVLSRAMSQGMGAVYAFMVGFLLVTLIYLMLVLFGIQHANLDILFLSILIKSLAAVYLIYMGVKGLQPTTLSYDEHGREEGASFFDNFLSAVILTASNPLVIVFYAGIVPSIVDVANITNNDIAIITFIVLGIEGGIVFLYCLPLVLLGKKIPIKYLKNMRLFSSVILILIGLYIGFTAIQAQDILSVF